MSKKISKIEKQVHKDWAEMLVKDNMEFEKYYNSLYCNLKNRFDIEFQLKYSQSGKIDFIQELMDEIIEANHDAMYNYTMGERAEKKESALKGLFGYFETQLNNLYIPTVISETDALKISIKRDITKTDKFKFGVIFATKQIEQYITSRGTIHHSYTAPQIAKILEIPKARPYISATFADYPDKTSNGKNIFKDKKYMLAIHRHCLLNKLQMEPFFIKKLDEIIKSGV